jgi:hypothetical protein
MKKTAAFLARLSPGLGVALAAAIAPVYLTVGSFYSMNVFEPLSRMGGALQFVRMVKTGRRSS